MTQIWLCRASKSCQSHLVTRLITSAKSSNWSTCIYPIGIFKETEQGLRALFLFVDSINMFNRRQLDGNKIKQNMEVTGRVTAVQFEGDGSHLLV